jgi:hypothetical protein
VSKHKIDINRESGPAQNLIAAAATIGVVAAGAALFEVALIPGMVIGGAACWHPNICLSCVGACSHC